MKLDESHTFRSAFHNIEVIATEFDEPHPGRTLWRFKFMVDGQLQENPKLNYKWSGLHPRLDDYNIEDEEGKFIFIPSEDAVIYNVFTKKYHSIASMGETKNNKFVGNKFSEERLIIVRERGLQIISLGNFQTQDVIFPLGRYILLGAKFIDDLLIVHYKDLNDYQEYTKKYNFEKMDFE